MPCENVHEGLPGYQRAYLLRRMAAAVIRSMPRAAARQTKTRTTRQAETGRERRTARAEPGSAHTNTPSRPARPTTETADERPALPRSPHRTYDDTTVSAERLREQLRRERLARP